MLSFQQSCRRASPSASRQPHLTYSLLALFRPRLRTLSATLLACKHGLFATDAVPLLVDHPSSEFPQKHLGSACAEAKHSQARACNPRTGCGSDTWGVYQYLSPSNVSSSMRAAYAGISQAHSPLQL